jgi:hypothetical protein
VHRDDDGWLGHITFTRPGDARSLRTSDIFRESDALSVHLRFHEFDREALEAFLRSVTP